MADISNAELKKEIQGILKDADLDLCDLDLDLDVAKMVIPRERI